MSAGDYEQIWRETNARYLKLKCKGVYGDRYWNAIFEKVVEEHHDAQMEAARRYVG